MFLEVVLLENLLFHTEQEYMLFSEQHIYFISILVLEGAGVLIVTPS